MRIFEVVNVVVGADGARTLYEFLGHPAQCVDLGCAQDVGQYDKPVAPISGKGSFRQHDPSRRRNVGENC